MKKEIRLVALAFFSLFFGAGNLILPPYLGFEATQYWPLVALGFCITAILIPYLGILAHSKVQGGLFELASPVLGKLALPYTITIFLVCVTIAVPRTAAVTYELGVSELSTMPAWLSAVIFFGLVPLFALFRGRVLHVIGSYITPLLVGLMALLIGRSLLGSVPENNAINSLSGLFSKGVIEGYQTFDAIAAVVVGAVLVISVKNQFSYLSRSQQSVVLKKGGLWAAIALMLIYIGLIFAGATLGGKLELSATRSELLLQMSEQFLFSFGNLVLAIAVSLACFTTAVGILTGTADFVQEQLVKSRTGYVITILLGCGLGMMLATLGVDEIIRVAYPVLLLVYPLTIVLILLHLLPEKLKSKDVFYSVSFVTFLFSLPDALLGYTDWYLLRKVTDFLPLGAQQLGWLIPVVLTAAGAILIRSLRSRYDRPQSE
jgi:branched-chain amino acid:cation transporter, LIVCS family